MNRLTKCAVTAIIIFGTLPTTNAMNLSSENVSTVKKMKKKKKKGLSGNNLKKKKSFFTKAFGTNRP
tara:strand:+ start:157 stop:357 length:201 start_codon:yes stop_codon:yes gene_type:complete